MKATLGTDGTLLFWCPGCDEAHGIPVDGSRGWTWNRSLENPTVTPSILVRSGHYAPGSESQRTGECYCNYEARTGEPPHFKCTICHSFIKDGQIEFLSDCTHGLAGQTIELPDWEQQ